MQAAAVVQMPPVRRITQKYKKDGTWRVGVLTTSETGLNEDKAHFDCGCITVFHKNTIEDKYITDVFFNQCWSNGYYHIFCDEHRNIDYVKQLWPKFPVDDFRELILIQDFAREIQDLEYIPVPRTFLKKIANRNGNSREDLDQLLLTKKERNGRYSICKNRVDAWFRLGMDNHFDIVSSVLGP